LPTQHTDDIAVPSGATRVEDVQRGYRLFDTERMLHTRTLDGSSPMEIMEFDETADGTRSWRSYRELLMGRDLMEEDNAWESSPAGVDVHWAMTHAYDYFLDAHRRRGFDRTACCEPTFTIAGTIQTRRSTPVFATWRSATPARFPGR